MQLQRFGERIAQYFRYTVHIRRRDPHPQVTPHAAGRRADRRRADADGFQRAVGDRRHPRVRGAPGELRAGNRPALVILRRGAQLHDDAEGDERVDR